MTNTREMKRARELKKEVKKEIIKRRRFIMFARPIIICTYLFIPIFTLACLVDAFFPYMPDMVAYIGIAITSLGVFLGYKETMMDIKVRDAKVRYRRFVAKMSK